MDTSSDSVNLTVTMGRHTMERAPLEAIGEVLVCLLKLCHLRGSFTAILGAQIRGGTCSTALRIVAPRPPNAVLLTIQIKRDQAYRLLLLRPFNISAETFYQMLCRANEQETDDEGQAEGDDEPEPEHQAPAAGLSMDAYLMALAKVLDNSASASLERVTAYGLAHITAHTGTRGGIRHDKLMRILSYYWQVSDKQGKLQIILSLTGKGYLRCEPGKGGGDHTYFITEKGLRLMESECQDYQALTLQQLEERRAEELPDLEKELSSLPPPKPVCRAPSLLAAKLGSLLDQQSEIEVAMARRIELEQIVTEEEEAIKKLEEALRQKRADLRKHRQELHETDGLRKQAALLERQIDELRLELEEPGP